MDSLDDDKLSEQIFTKLEEYMFTRGNMAKYNKVFSAMIVEKIKEEKRNKLIEQLTSPQRPTPAAPVPVPAPVPAPAPVPVPDQVPAPVPIVIEKKKDTQFTPFQKDTLFWSFYIILNGFDEYELHNSDHFATEKQFKIATVEKMREMKDTLKEAKLKRNEIEDELVNQPMITLKGLHALCLVHNVSITYIYGRMYCEFLYSTTNNTSTSGVIIKTNKNKNENSVKYDSTEEYMTSIRNTFWKIENIQKPLGTASAYSVKELQDICNKLEIPIVVADTGKNKLKTALYEDILHSI
jgi:hypothetical protein